MKWKNLLQAIADTGMTQVQIAKKAGCSQATISVLLSGRADQPSFSLGTLLIRIAKRRGVKAPQVILPNSHETEPATAAQEV